MIALHLSAMPATTRQRHRRQRFGLDAPLPADPAIVERAIVRHLATAHPAILAFAIRGGKQGLTPPPDGSTVDLASGAPTLLLLLPGGRAAWLAVRAQAHRPTRAERAFADLSASCGAPVHAVRSLPEAVRVLARLDRKEPNDG